MLNAFICEFCNCLVFSPEWMQAHEQTCAYNPKNSNNTISARPSGGIIITVSPLRFWKLPTLVG